MLKYRKKLILNKIQKIKEKNKNIFIFSYYDVTAKEDIKLKKVLKDLKFKSIILKKKLRTIKINNSGNLLIIYNNTNIDNNIVKLFFDNNKIEFIYCILNNIIFSNLKIKKILNKNNNNILNKIILKPLFKFMFFLNKKASIT